MARNMDVAPVLVFFVVYDTATSTVRKVTFNNTDSMVGAYLRHAPMFHAADISNEWERFVTPTVVGLQPPDQQERVVTRQWGYPQVILQNAATAIQYICRAVSHSFRMQGTSSYPAGLVSVGGQQ